MKYKYGLLSYRNTNNIGDEIQSIASNNFLMQVNELIERDKISKYKGEKVKLILNGWFMNEPKNFPPSKNILPLFISFHIDPRCYKELLSQKCIEYYKKYQPIGCRDYTTKKVLEEKGVKCYFSGCLTLTLNKIGLEKNNKILLVDVDKEIEDKIPDKFKKDIINLTHYNDSDTIIRFKKFIYSSELIKKITNNPYIKKIKRKLLTENKSSKEKFEEAENLLRMYEQARFIITSRIHVALPCLALGTNVVLIVDDKNDARYEGLIELLNCYTHKEYMNKEFDFEKNPETYKKYRNELIKTCEEFLND